MTEMGRCRVCDRAFSVGAGGYFRRVHGPRKRRCTGSHAQAVGFGGPMYYPKPTIVKSAWGKA